MRHYIIWILSIEIIYSIAYLLIVVPASKIEIAESYRLAIFMIPVLPIIRITQSTSFLETKTSAYFFLFFAYLILALIGATITRLLSRRAMK